MALSAADRKRLRAIERVVNAKRNAVELSIAPAFARDVAAYFRRLSEIATVVWTAEQAAFASIVERHFLLTADVAYGDTTELLGTTVVHDPSSPIGQRFLAGAAAIALSISKETENKVASLTESAPEGSVNSYLTDAILQWAGVDGIDASRAMVIARTETAHAYTWSSGAAYRESGLVPDVVCLDSPDCGWDGHDDPELADGTIRTLDEMDEYPTSHPNCVRAFAPNVIGATDSSDNSDELDSSGE